jgi:hypothetical protein
MRVPGWLVLTAAFAATSLPSAAQTPRYAGPEYVGVVEARVQGVTRQLERQRIAVTAKMKAFGLGGVRAGYEFPQGKSPLRFRAGEPVEFVIRVTSQDIDPRSFVQFSRVTSKKYRRLLTTMTFGYGGSTSTGNFYDVPFEARRHGTTLFRITPTTPLTPGEYMLTSNSTDAFLFGVD